VFEAPSKEDTDMTDTNGLQFAQPGTFGDPLTEVLRNGARALLAQAVDGNFARPARRRGQR
jgi:putative transposase